MGFAWRQINLKGEDANNNEDELKGITPTYTIKMHMRQQAR